MQIQENKSISTILYVKSLVQSYGISGLYKGAIPTLWRESIAMGIYFSMYEWIKCEMLKTKEIQPTYTVDSLDQWEV